MSVRLRILLVPLLCLAAAPALGDTPLGAAAGAFTVNPWLDGLGPVTDFRFLPDGSVLWLEKTGAVRLRHPDGTLVLVATLDVDASSEKGALGLAIDPGFAQNGFVYVYYSRSDAAGGTDLDRNRVSRFTLQGNAFVAGSEQVLVDGIDGPANHDGGGLEIGPDGKLYVAVGDAGCDSGAAPGGAITNYFGTCLTNVQGKILRLNLDGSVPADNPLQGQVTACATPTASNYCATGPDVQPNPAQTGAPAGAIWAWGFRNPFRIWVDPQTGRLWAADVGERSYEELDVVQGGHHYGWPWREGPFGYDVSTCATYTPGGDCVDPIYACKHPNVSGTLDDNCQAIIGGLIVDSCTWPAPFRGRYYFGDAVNGRIWSLQLDAQRTAVSGAAPREDFAQVLGGGPVAFRTGPDGALYVAVLASSGPSRIDRIAPLLPASCPAPDGGTDAGVADGGVADGGAVRHDGGAGAIIGGGGGPPAEPKAGCGCSSGPGALGAALLLFAVSLLAGRRRRN